MAYDPVRHETVLFGGVDVSNTGLRDTWLWDGSRWTEAHPSGSLPPARTGAAMVWDPNKRRILLVGGAPVLPTTGECIGDARCPNRFLADVWAWDGNGWTTLPTSTDFRDQLPYADQVQLALDQASGAVVMITREGYASWPAASTLPAPSTCGTPHGAAQRHVGGAYPSACGQLTVGTWQLVGDTFVRAQEGVNDVELNGGAGGLVYDPAVRRMLFLDQTVFAWDGQQWSPYEGIGEPAAEVTDAVAFATAPSGIVAVRGDGSTWVSVDGKQFTSGGSLPARRAGEAVAADANGRVVLFGGRILTTCDFAWCPYMSPPPSPLPLPTDTWTWDTKGWRARG